MAARPSPPPAPSALAASAAARQLAGAFMVEELQIHSDWVAALQAAGTLGLDTLAPAAPGAWCGGRALAAEDVQLGALLRAGGHGSVYSATVSGRSVALKFMGDLVRAGDDGNCLRRVSYATEAALGALLAGHPGFCCVAEAVVMCGDGGPFDALEGVSGRGADGVELCMVVPDLMDGDLCTLLGVMFTATDRLLMAFVCEMLLAVATAAAALADAHAVGLVHNDVKPNNILYRSTPEEGLTYKVGDLGLMAVLGRSYRGGTPGFMAPESMRPTNPSFSGASDVCSLGLTLCYLMKHIASADLTPGGTCQGPVSGAGAGWRAGDSEEAKWDREARGALDHVRYLSGVPRALMADVYRLAASCLQYNPLQRPTAAAVAARLTWLRDNRR